MKNKSVISLILAVVMVFSMIPSFNMTAAAEGGDTRVADASTMDGWKDIFGEDVMSTENAGSVWTDKSVFTDASAFSTVAGDVNGKGITLDGDDNRSFLVALSAMASNTQITGRAVAPMDTILVLDVSGSMNGDYGSNDVAEDLVESANESIDSLLDANKDNRIGIVLYSGASASTTNADAAVLMLPLGRYTPNSNGNYLAYSESDGGEYISIASGVKVEGGDAPGSVRKEVVGATYIQKGIYLAMQQFTSASNSPQTGALPVLLLMSDGSPTLSTTDFTAPGQYNLGNGKSSSTSAAQGFVTQLTAAYAKTQIEEKYGQELLFYTLGFKIDEGSVAESVLDPASSLTAIDDFWEEYNNADAEDEIIVESTGYWSGRGPNRQWVEVNKSVTKISEALEQEYVTRYYSETDDLTGAFANIISDALLQAKYYPTLVQTTEDLSGYVSFVDRIGKYMEVTDVKGVLINNTLYSGADLSRNFVTGGGDLGTYDEPTHLGDEMIGAVQARFGIENIETARTLVGLAYEYGQLSYNEETKEFSNYIGWYANAAGEYLGFWHEGSTTVPEATGNVDTDPAYLIKSYGYLGAVDEADGVAASDMMYATIQIRENIKTGEQSVAFAVPAALIPVTTYEVTLDENGDLENLAVSGAEHPIRLVYEVSLKDGIDEITLENTVSQEYLSDNTDPNGAVSFYTNQYEKNDSTGYGKVNTYSYFRPSRQNEKYYYQENSVIYTDVNGTEYSGATKPSAGYVAYDVYVKDGNTLKTETHYRELAADALETAVAAGDGTWYIPAGNVRVSLDAAKNKATNETGTLAFASSPFVDTYGHSLHDDNHRYVVGSTLGNNGKLSITPATGIALSKAVARVSDDPGAPTEFEFTITGSNTVDANATYSARRVSADGVEEAESVEFNASGIATVKLKDGETLYITGMTAGNEYAITETETEYYAVAPAEGAQVTVAANELVRAEFINTSRGTGTLTVWKFIEHGLGADYVIPEERSFEMTVTLSGIGTANKTFAATHTGNAGITSVSTDENGKFTVTLKHDEAVEIFGLPQGTTATVAEQDPGAGFTAKYLVDGVLGDGTVTIDESADVAVVNGYNPTKVDPVNLEISGTKDLLNASDSTVADWENYTFTVVLEMQNGTGWTEIDRQTLTSSKQSFTFDLSEVDFDSPGVYNFQAYEIEPEGNEKIPGIFYDNVWHTFSVTVGDPDMDGQLEITDIASAHGGHSHITEPSGGETAWKVKTDFTNTVYEITPATAVIEFKKVMTEDSSPISLAGYELGLYKDTECQYEITAEEFSSYGIQKIDNVKSDGSGEGWIDIIFEYDSVCNYPLSYEFYVKEKDSGISGMTYDQTATKVTIELNTVKTEVPEEETEIVTGLKATVTYADGTELIDDTFLKITNEYIPTPAELDFSVFATKTLTGRDMEAGEFSFEIEPLEDNPKGAVYEESDLVGENSGAQDGVAAKISFGKISFNRPGTFFFNVKETSVDGNGVTVDRTVFHVVVTVTDVGGELRSAHRVLNIAEDTVDFKNTYTAAPAEYTVSGKKTLSGKDLLNDEFTFVLKEAADESGSVRDGGTELKAKNLVDGSFTFEKLTLDAPGTYYYVVSELEESAAHGITFDKTSYLVTVVVTDNGAGQLEAVPTLKVLGGEAVSEISFENKYEPASAAAGSLSGSKILTGKVLNEGDYSFNLYAADRNAEGVWSKTGDEPIETVSNGGDGTFAFTKLGELRNGSYVFDRAGSYYYIVTETNGGKDIDGVLYDSTEYHVWVQVTDDLKGQLHATVHIFEGHNIPQLGISFENEYRITSDGSAVIEGKKVLSGRNLTDDDKFSFSLYEADENFVVGEKIETVQNVGESFKFSEIKYTSEDIGKTFHYVVKEDEGVLDNISYSSESFNVTVTVEDGGDGSIKTVTEVENGPISFTNTFTPENIDVTVKVKKTVKNLGSEKIGPEGFVFELKNLESGLVAKKTSDTDGLAAFDFEFSANDIGETYSYLLTESRGSDEHTTYSSAQYNISISISVDEAGVLSAAITENGDEVEAVSAEFENIYDYTPQNKPEETTGSGTSETTASSSDEPGQTTEPDDTDNTDETSGSGDPDDTDNTGEPGVTDDTAGSGEPGVTDDSGEPGNPDGTDSSDGSGDSGAPGTGNNSRLPLWIALMFVSSIGIVGTVVSGRKRKNNR